MVKNCTLNGATWANTSATSPVQYQSNTSATHTGGEDLYSSYLTATTQASSSFNIGKELFKYQLERNGLTNTAYDFTVLITCGTNSSNVIATVTWQEIT